MANKDDRFVPLAEVMRPHGVRGELRLKVFNAESDLLLDQEEVIVREKDGPEHEVSVDQARRADQAILLKLHSVDDRNRAEELRGAIIGLRRSQFPPAEEGAFYACDVEGAKVVVKEAEGAREIGTVRSLTSYPSVDVLVVQANDGGKDWEIPLVEGYVAHVDVDGGVVTLHTLDDLER
ncbi:ribosome maturation factor RimM [Pendulispora brunnea]|uniref:Ribosome maturation factor RimM n=1 Tax=Pendulispora brunnea TaxID=2905690 RepID=A0ABZ2KK75_9BACT